MSNNGFGFGGGGLAGDFVFSGFQDASQQGIGLSAGSGLGNSGVFNNIFGQLSGGIQQNAAQGIAPGQRPNGKMTSAQIAAQLQIGGGGITSLLPMLGNRFLPNLMFPIAGAMTFVQVFKSALEFGQEFSHPKQQLGLSIEDLNYSKAVSTIAKSGAVPGSSPVG